jgi:hypothetical protein
MRAGGSPWLAGSDLTEAILSDRRPHEQFVAIYYSVIVIDHFGFRLPGSRWCGLPRGSPGKVVRRL